MYISQVFPRETGPKGFAYIEINYFKELACALIDIGTSKICRAGWQAGDPGRISVICNPLLLWGNFEGFFLKTSTD